MSMSKYVKFVAIVGMVFCGLSVVAHGGTMKIMQPDDRTEGKAKVPWISKKVPDLLNLPSLFYPVFSLASSFN